MLDHLDHKIILVGNDKTTCIIILLLNLIDYQEGQIYLDFKWIL